MKEENGRAYKMVARAKASAKTAERILQAASSLWREHSIDDITLDTIAERAGISKRTVLRHYDSKEGVFSEAIKRDAANIIDHRSKATVGDVSGALDILIDHYEKDGNAVFRTLLVEEKVPAAKLIIEAGREEHRTWCARVFAPFLPAHGDKTYKERLDALVGATDLYLWKLLRHDLGRTSEETKRTLKLILEELTRPRV